MNSDKIGQQAAVIYDYQDFQIESLDVESQQQFSVPQQEILASQIADLLIKESQDQAQKSNGKKQTPFVKEALPGEDQTVSRRTHLLGFVKFSSIAYIALNLFVNGSVYDFWGNGNSYMIMISFIQLGCAVYSYLLSTTMDMATLRSIYNLRVLYLIMVGIVSLPVTLLTFVALYSFQESDQLASYTISTNLLQYCFTNLFAFLTLVGFTYFLLGVRQYELDDANIDFKSDYHFGPKETSSMA